MAILTEIPVTIQITSVVPNEMLKGLTPGETYPATAKEFNGLTLFWKVSFERNGVPCSAWAVPADMKHSHLTTCVIVQPPTEKINEITVIDPQILN